MTQFFLKSWQCSMSRVVCGQNCTKTKYSLCKSRLDLTVLAINADTPIFQLSDGDLKRAVNFTFKNDTAIPRKWLSLTVGEFWAKADAAGIYFKPADIKAKVVTLLMLVPDRATVSSTKKKLNND